MAINVEFDPGFCLLMLTVVWCKKPYLWQEEVAKISQGCGVYPK
jgi:hypothetical protein